MKKLFLFSLLCLFLLSGFEAPRLVELTLVNKSGVELAVQLNDPQDDENFYYLTVAEGDRVYPEEKTFEIKPAAYSMLVYYMETWDPVYGYPECKGIIQKTKLLARHKMRVVFTECDAPPRNTGEPSMLKFWTYIRFLYPYKYIY